MTGSIYALGPDDEWALVDGVTEITPTLTADAVAEAAKWMGDIEPLTWTTPFVPLRPDEWQQFLAVQRVRAGAIAWWNEAQR